MPSAYILQDSVTVHLKSRSLEITRTNPDTGRPETLRQIHIHDLERLILNENVQISSQAVAELMREKVPLSLLGWNGRFLGGFLPVEPAHGSSRILQYRRSMDVSFSTLMARQFIHAKIYNQRRVVQRLEAARRNRNASAETEESQAETHSASPNDPNPEKMTETSMPSSQSAAVRDLGRFLEIIEKPMTIDELRGYEGASTSRYFSAWAAFLPDEAPFERRSTRPPLNPVNACISFGSTLLYQEAVAFLHAHGLDPSIGNLHTTENGRWSLGLDFIEPFRPAVGEALTLDLFSRSILSPSKHFEPRDGGFYLDHEGRRKFILQYERRMERQFMSEFAGHRTTLRQQLEEQARHYKSALENPESFRAFLMN